MKNTILSTALSLFLVVFAFGQDSRQLKGKVTDGKSPIENVNIKVEGKSVATLTDKEGKYQIEVATGDRVSFSYTGLKTVNIKVEDVTRILNPIMIPDITELDEVEVTASKRRSQKDMEEDYVINKSIIRTAWGFLDADRAAGNVRILTEDDINPVNLCLLDLVRGKFAGVSVIGSCNGLGGAITIRGANSLSSSSQAIYDIDGQIFTDFPVWLDINNIKRIAILANLGITASYGNLGRGGVIVINTIGGNPKVDKFVDRARLKNNYVSGDVLSSAEVAKNAPNYLKEFMASGSFESSKVIFEKYENTYASSPYFLLDAYLHFSDTHNELEYADTIIDTNFGIYANNPVLLKALAYIYESQQRFEKANAAYKEVFILRPNYAQSYMDMANSYRNLREPKQAASMYARYEYLMEEGFMERDTAGFGPIQEREYNNLLALEKGNLMEGIKAQKLFVAEEDFKGTRLVFEWNDGEAEFDLQFVNPENQYHKWKHSIADNADVIDREKNFGYNVKEYLIDGSLPGTWQVNINYLGNKSLTPSYLKATVYYDYGSRNQRKEVKVFKLSLKNMNQELFRLQSSSKMATR